MIGYIYIVHIEFSATWP